MQQRLSQMEERLRIDTEEKEGLLEAFKKVILQKQGARHRPALTAHQSALQLESLYQSQKQQPFNTKHYFQSKQPTRHVSPCDPL